MVAQIENYIISLFIDDYKSIYKIYNYLRKNLKKSFFSGSNLKDAWIYIV